MDLPEHLGNCVFCVKKGINKIALAARDEPKMAEDFINLIEDPNIRVVERGQQANKIMYRGNNSLVSIMALYQNHSRDDILATIRGGGWLRHRLMLRIMRVIFVSVRFRF